MGNKVWTILCLFSGFWIGKNWKKISNKIKRKAKPSIEKISEEIISGAEEARKFLEEQRKKAISKIKLKKRKVRAKAASTT